MPSQLPPRQQLAAANKWPIIGEREPAPLPQAWTLWVEGLVENRLRYSLADLAQLPYVERPIDIHCVTRWSKLGLVFGGVRLADVLAPAEVFPSAKYLHFVAHSPRDHNTSLPLADALAADALLAWNVDGRPLPLEHGGPLRLIMPDRYFYKSLKWLVRIQLLEKDRLGYWESTAGYHNVGDPWLEQRYVAPDLTREQSAQLVAQRNISGQHHRSLSVAGLDLTGLNAAKALLRDADFTGCCLEGANFRGANLSNALFRQASLKNADFTGADLEGADFTAADLCGADLRGSSLVAATFLDEAGSSPAARLDATTRWDQAALDQLLPAQAAYLARSAGK
jgi:DMSO/TMAO reductase YedYZ molybdopterin-dependent catalytic subunit